MAKLELKKVESKRIEEEGQHDVTITKVGKVLRPGIDKAKTLTDYGIKVTFSDRTGREISHTFFTHSDKAQNYLSSFGEKLQWTDEEYGNVMVKENFVGRKCLIQVSDVQNPKTRKYWTEVVGFRKHPTWKPERNVVEMEDQPEPDPAPAPEATKAAPVDDLDEMFK